MQDQPSPDAILASVVAWLRDTATDALPAHARFEAKVAVGAIELARRQIGTEPSEGEEVRMLSALVRDTAGLDAMTARLCAEIESGETDLSTPGLSDLLIATTLNKIDIDQPEFSAAARLRALAQRG